MNKINKKSKNYSQQLTEMVANTALSMNAENIIILDMKKEVDFTDYFIICQGDNKMQIKAIADEIIGKLEKADIKDFNIEGYDNKEWILIDAFDVICHIFDEEKRNYYNIENLWGDVPQKTIDDTK
ncbi:MAG: ribosome silencing factor [Candidatus Marinimicrobia bacterium]|nr:ribosome silencing factor [Candidatus Neomarinimicrobiota bacterium]